MWCVMTEAVVVEAVSPRVTEAKQALAAVYEPTLKRMHKVLDELR